MVNVLGCEALFIVKGKLKVKLFDEYREFLKDLILSKGDCLVMACVHSIEVLDDVLVLEVKEGSYPGKEHDKVWLK